jgi:hypothetical protein
MPTPQWIKKLSGHAGELFVCAELSKRGIPNALLPENFPHDDILVSNKDGTLSGYVQVKACHPARSVSFYLTEKEEAWRAEGPNKFCVLVWLGEAATNQPKPPRYWIALKREVGELCAGPLRDQNKNPLNPERRLLVKDTPAEWENRWGLFDVYRPEDHKELRAMELPSPSLTWPHERGE